MNKILIVLVFFVSVCSLSSQEIEVLDFDQLEHRLKEEGDTVLLINFWATWCKPCAEEMPDFVQLNNDLKDMNFRMLLVSLDMPSAIEARLPKFIADFGINSELVILDDPDFNSWIDKVDTSWSGSIPATLIIYPGYRKFIEGSLDYKKIRKFVEPGLKSL